jgi:FixJ family two-component response regulator
MVCIIDGDPEMRDTLARLVQGCGLPARTYDSAEAFLAGADTSAVDCLLVASELSGMSGIDLLETLAPVARFPVFLLGELWKARDAERASSLGTIAIEKPFNARALGKRIRAAVGMR